MKEWSKDPWMAELKRLADGEFAFLKLSDHELTEVWRAWGPPTSPMDAMLLEAEVRENHTDVPDAAVQIGGSIIPFSAKVPCGPLPFDPARIIREVKEELGLDAAIVGPDHPTSVSGSTTLHFLGGDEDVEEQIERLMGRYAWPDDGAHQFHDPRLPRTFPFGPCE